MDLRFTTKSAKGRVGHKILLTGLGEKEAERLQKELEAKLLQHSEPAYNDREAWVALDVTLPNGDRWEKGSPIVGNVAWAKKVIGSRARITGPAPKRGAAAARGGRAAAPAAAAPKVGLFSRLSSSFRKSEQFAVFIESAKGSAKRIGKALYFATEAAAIERAKALLAQIEKDVGVHGQHKNSAKVRVDVVHAPSRQLVAQTHWVKT